LLGMPTIDTVSWFPYTNGATGAADITNQYLVFGLAAGLVAIFLLVLILKRSFRDLGIALRILRARQNGNRDGEFIYWGLGVMLAVHAFNWFGISYFDQTYVLWFMQLAVIRNLSANVIASESTSIPLRPSEIMRKIPA